MREGALENQERGKLGIGGAIVKDLCISHPTNASIEIHSGNIPKEPTTNVRII
jgi:hypothetical protein